MWIDGKVDQVFSIYEAENIRTEDEMKILADRRKPRHFGDSK
jgi:hypothetical protein